MDSFGDARMLGEAGRFVAERLGVESPSAYVIKTAHAGQAIAITTSVGDQVNARRSQPLVTLSVK